MTRRSVIFSEHASRFFITVGGIGTIFAVTLIFVFLFWGFGYFVASLVDALEAGVAALALDQARQEGRVVDLRETWAQFDAHGLRA